MDMNIFTLVGEIVVVGVVIILILIAISLILGVYQLENKKLVFPRVLLFAINLTYPTTKRMLKLLNMDELLIRADLRGINKDNISLYSNQYTGDITEYITTEYFNCKDRIQWVNQ